MHDVGVSFPEIKIEFCYSLYANLDKLKQQQQLVSKHRDKLLKGILFLLNHFALNSVANMHQKLGDFHFEVQNHPACLPDLAPYGLLSLF
jgi:hypothetical protein